VSEIYQRKANCQCLVCKKPIYRRPGVIKNNGDKVYCSRNCYGIACRIEIPCSICGKMILSGLNKKTCSRKCSNIHRTGIKYKNNQPKDVVKYYKGLKTRLLKLRDDKCEICGYNRQEILQVHHVDKNRDHNSIENLQLLCPNCHFEKHYAERSWLKYS
jgi:hypothetical protein